MNKQSHMALGKTESGKLIFARYDKESTSNFTREDHLDAMNVLLGAGIRADSNQKYELADIYRELSLRHKKAAEE